MWKTLNIEMKLAQPLAVGPGWRLGFVMLTRLDIPPRTLWGAFTDAMTRYKGTNHGPDNLTIPINHGSNPFLVVGDWVSANIRFLPGMLVAKDGEDGREVKERVLPWYYFGMEDRFTVWDQKANWREMPESIVRSRYISGSGSTALDCEHMAADEGTLHETERIMPKIRMNDHIWDVWIDIIAFVRGAAAEGIKSWLENNGTGYLRVGRDVGAGDGCFEEIFVEEIDTPGAIGEMRRLENDTITWRLEEESTPILSVRPLNGDLDEKPHIRLPGPFLTGFKSSEIQGYWGELRPHIVREFDVSGKQGFGRKMGYPDDTLAMWILEHGGVLAVDSADKSYTFGLQRDGWYRYEAHS
jgi:hypothetical protein